MSHFSVSFRVRSGSVGCSIASALALGIAWWSSACAPAQLSDPNAWAPPPDRTVDAASTRMPVGVELDADAIDAGPTDCTVDPPLDLAVRVSTAMAVSHRPGENCLEGCHAQGGSARLSLEVGGTLYASGDSKTVTSAGNTVDGIGQTTLFADRCGNFYATGTSLNGPLSTSQPSVRKTIVLKMRLPMSQPGKDMGSCNQSRCHDFSSADYAGIHE